MPLVFASICPHPPIILPSVGSEEDREKVKKTIIALENLGKKFKEANPDCIIISSPHPDWGFNVPLFFLARRSLDEGGLAKDFLPHRQAGKGEIKAELMGTESPEYYFKKGKDFYSKELKKDKNYALIASGDLSHCLKEDGPYGFQPDGPKFDKELIDSLKKKDIKNILKLDEKYPQAGECGLRSFCFLLGMLEASGVNWKPEISSYEGPFGVGYLVANFKL